MTSLYISVFVTVFIYAFIMYFLNTFVYVLMCSVFGYFASLFTKIKMRYAGILNVSICYNFVNFIECSVYCG